MIIPTSLNACAVVSASSVGIPASVNFVYFPLGFANRSSFNAVLLMHNHVSKVIVVTGMLDFGGLFHVKITCKEINQRDWTENRTVFISHGKVRTRIR